MKSPWKWSEDGCQLIDDDGRTVLRIRPSDATQVEFAAIAAAPELLKALEALANKADATGDCDHKRLSCQDVGCIGHEIKIARAAIAKAKRQS